MSRARWIAVVALGAYLAVIILANYLTNTFHAVPVWPGLLAPAGTYAAGAALLLRDVVQDRAGRPAVFAAIAAGGLLSVVMSNPSLALASFAAFTVAEVLDMVVYTPLRARNWPVAVLASNTVGALVDSVIFLSLAGFGLTAATIGGQLVGKLVWATAAPLAIVLLIRAATRVDIPGVLREVPCTAETLVTVRAPLVHLCPHVDEVDRGSVLITWCTTNATIELHSLRAWLRTWEAVRISHEVLAHKILSEIAATAVEPVQVVATFHTAGMGVTVRAVPGEPVHARSA